MEISGAEILESMADAFVAIDRDWRYTYANRAAERIVGLSREKMLGRTVWELFPKQDTPSEKALRRAMDEGETVHYEDYFAPLDIWFKVTVYPTSNGIIFHGRDITEGKRAEVELKKHEEQLKDAQRLAHLGSWEWDIATNTVTWSNELCRVCGVDRQEFGATYEAVMQLVHPDDREFLSALIDRAYREHEPYVCEHRIICPDGAVRTLQSRGAVVVDNTGNVVRMHGTGQDITERKQAEERLAFHALLLENVHDAIVATDERLTLTAWNRAAEEMYGWKAEEVIGREVREVVRSEYPEERRAEAFRLLSETGQWRGEVIHHRKDGTPIHIEGNIMALKDATGRVTGYVFAYHDITERKRTEERLREYEKVVEGLEEMIVVIDRDYRYLIANRAFLNYRGLESSQLVGRLVTELLDKEVFEKVAKKKLDECLQGRVVKYELRYTYPQLGERDLFISYFPIKGPDGIDRVACILQDITERKRAEEALRQAQARIESILNSVADTHILFDHDWRYLYVNEAAVRAIGRPREQILGRTLWEIYPDIVGTELGRQYRRAMEERIHESFDFHYRTLDTWWENRFYPAPEGLSVYATDITERKRAEEQLRQSEERLRQLAENITEVFWLTDPDKQKILYVSPAYEKIWGRPCESVYEQPTAWIDAIHPNDRDRVEKAVMTQQVLGGYDEEYRIIRPDGRVRWIRDRAFPVNDESGRVYRVTGIAEDITERKLAEEKLRATTEQLRALSARLQSAREEEGARIAREIHDELGGALTSLSWDLESVDKVISESGDQPRLQALRERIEAMLRLTETTISNVRRISAELRPGILDDLGLLEAIEWQAGQFQARTGITCRCDCSLENLDLGREQSTAVFRIFQEALTNILRHAQATSVDITTKVEAGEFVLKIIDNGRGITENERTGARSLGLLGMRERAHLIGGKININGVEGEGTVITVRVPLSG
jgi:PAS domain S-box-containing protein